jgi:hypothetical protein
MMNIQLIAALVCLAGFSTQIAAENFNADLVRDPTLLSPVNETSAKQNPTVLEAKEIVAIFEQACVQTQGNSPAAIDWALTNSFEPIDMTREGAVQTLLQGQSGSVLAAPNTEGRVMLTVTTTQCSVWAERTPGPALRAALSAWLSGLVLKGAKAQALLDRSVERAGAWRHHMKWRYRAVGARHDATLSGLTTLTNTPGTQVLHWAMNPQQTTQYAPDGIPALSVLP